MPSNADLEHNYYSIEGLLHSCRSIWCCPVPILKH